MTAGTIKDGDGQVVFQYRRELSHPMAQVWAAITEPAAIAAWMGTEPEIDLRPGGDYITHHLGGERVVDRVLRVQPTELFEHTFFEHVNPGAVVTWRLQPRETGTDLELTHVMSHGDLRTAMTAVRPGDDLGTVLARNGAGWHRLLDLVQAHLDATTPTWSEDDQRRLQSHYQEHAQSAAQRLELSL